MKKSVLIQTMVAGIVLSALAGAAAISGPDKYKVQVPGGLAFAEFKGWSFPLVTTMGDLPRFLEIA